MTPWCNLAYYVVVSTLRSTVATVNVTLFMLVKKYALLVVLRSGVAREVRTAPDDILYGGDILAPWFDVGSSRGKGPECRVT